MEGQLIHRASSSGYDPRADFHEREYLAARRIIDFYVCTLQNSTKGGKTLEPRS